MKIDLTKEEIKKIIETFKRYLRSCEIDAEHCEMALNEDFVNSHNKIIKKLEEAFPEKKEETLDQSMERMDKEVNKIAEGSP